MQKQKLREATRVGLLLGGFGLFLASPAFAQQAIGEAEIGNIPAELQSQSQDEHIETTACESCAVPECDSCGGSCDSCDGSCEEGDPCAHLQGLFTDNSGSNWLDDNGISINGWLEAGITFNGNGNGTNQPVGFNNLNGSPMLNQFYLILARDAATNEDEFGIGFQMDLLIGNDSDDASAFGGRDGSFDNDWTNNSDGDIDNIGVAMPQLYMSFYAPIGNGLTVNIGHFYTTIGYEGVPAPNNFFYSHAYTMQFGEPFTHTGALGYYDLTDNISVTSGIVTGWDDFENEGTSWSYLGGVSWTSDDENTSVAFNLINGDEPAVAGEANRTMYSIVVTRKISEKLTYIFQHDRGEQNSGALRGGGAVGKSEWYGINQYLFYDLTDTTSLGVNYEWFRDDDGTQVGFGPANYQVMRVGVNHKISDCIMVRPEMRWDWADNNARPFGGTQAQSAAGIGTRGSQFTIGTDVIFRF